VSEDERLTTGQVAARLGLSVDKVRRLVSQGVLTAIRPPQGQAQYRWRMYSATEVEKVRKEMYGEQ
jgi:excisionase family DNA binding protein